ncbi:VOC family protein [Nocardioides bigeumensis]|uniref:Glyoxalase-like domain-containing protein n=1 Tax=Nocardioides bigeumensis TaxID=433657 RepID=A0ABP5KES4_9ACTN
MSEQGWREFLAADGVDDWVVLHGGPVAVYDAGSMVAAARLAGLVAAVPGLEGSRAALTISGTLLTVRMTRELWGIETEHVDLARAISAVAREHGAAADRGRVQEVQLAVAAKPDEIDLPFWRAVLGYDPMADDNGVDPLAHSSTVWMQDLDPGRSLRHAMHVDVSVAKEHLQARVDAAVAAGGRIVERTDADTHIFADRAGNKVCVCAWPDSGNVG